MSRAVILLSGGLDSCVTAAIAKAEGHDLYCLSFDYGQRHGRELQAARDVAEALGAAEHKVLHPAIGELGGSALTDRAIDVPTGRGEAEMSADIPVTYVPARNTIMVAYGLGYAEVTASDAVYIGANALDYSGYPDCRPEYFEAYQGVADLATKRAVEGHPVRIEAPIIHMTKADIVRRGLDLGAPLERTWSCYQGGDAACGRCDSCQLRLKGFEEAGVADPVAYAPRQ